MKATKNFENYLKLKRLVDAYYDVQDVRTRTENRLRVFPAESRSVYPGQLKLIEFEIKEEIMQLVQDDPIWIAFMNKWRGLGPCLAGGLIANIMVRFVKRDPETELEAKWALKTGSHRDEEKEGDEEEDDKKEVLVPELRGIGAFANPSKLHAFCGLDVVDGHAPKKVRGKRESVTWSPKMRVLCWKLGQQFVKQGRYYRGIYLEARAMYDARPELQTGKGAKGHRYAMAKRKMVKQFLTDLWAAWRTLEGLSTVNPYVIDKLHHANYRVPPALGDREEATEIKPEKVGPEKD